MVGAPRSSLSIWMGLETPSVRAASVGFSLSRSKTTLEQDDRRSIYLLDSDVSETLLNGGGEINDHL